LLQPHFLAGNDRAAIAASSNAQRLFWSVTSHFEAAEFRFYDALAHAVTWDSAAADAKQRHLQALTAHLSYLQLWAENCPENFDNRAALVGAEIALIGSRDLDAERLHEQAIRSAHANAFIHNEALANELAARFYAARGCDKIAHTYLRDARSLYLSCDADGKVRRSTASIRNSDMNDRCPIRPARS
jgi:hypothetical protein